MLSSLRLYRKREDDQKRHFFRSPVADVGKVLITLSYRNTYQKKQPRHAGAVSNKIF